MKCPYCEKEIAVNDRFCPHCDGYIKPTPAPKPATAPKPTATPAQTTKICPSCKRTVPINSVFCQNCGASIKNYSQQSTTKRCSYCKATMPTSARFCPVCGKPVSNLPAGACCARCRYSTPGTLGMFCTYFTTDDSYQRVSSSGVCDHYSEAPSKYNSNYRDSGNGNNSSCFLTSACVEYLGKPDDCEELQTLRKFRDEKLKFMEGGEELIQEYYRVAPTIVGKIDASPDKASYYDYIYGCITKCMERIQANDDAEALNLYKNMVVALQTKFSV